MIWLQDFGLIAFLVFLEGILSVDNALVLAMMVRPLPPKLHRPALTYGLAGAALFRLGALSFVRALIQAHWLKFLGGFYLIFIAVRHLWRGSQSPAEQAGRRMTGKPRSLWRTVVLIELMDIAFAADSILAAVAVTRRLWIVFAGGMIGVILLRFAANQFVRLLERFPRFEKIAYVLVLEIGGKLVVDGFALPGLRFESPANAAFWAFWGVLAATISAGFVPPEAAPPKPR